MLSDRVAVMTSGALQQFDARIAICRRPAKLIVGAFIGSPQMIVLPGAAEGVELAGELTLIEPAGPFHYHDLQVGELMIKATHLFDRDSGLRVPS